MRPRFPTRRSGVPVPSSLSRGSRLARARAAMALVALTCFAFSTQAMASPDAETARATSVGAPVYHTRFQLEGADGIREVAIEGRVRFSADESHIEWLDDGAYVRIITGDAGHRNRFDVTAGGQGQPVMRMTVDGRARTFDAEAQRRLADTLPVVFRELGHDAEGRVRRIRAEGGTVAVLGMIAGIRSAYSTRLHYEAYLKLDGLTDAEISGALARLGGDVGSDGELASLLYAAAELYRDRPGIRAGYLACLARIGSDAERMRVTRSLFGVETIGAGEQPELSLKPGDC